MVWEQIFEKGWITTDFHPQRLNFRVVMIHLPVNPFGLAEFFEKMATQHAFVFYMVLSNWKIMNWSFQSSVAELLLPFASMAVVVVLLFQYIQAADLVKWSWLSQSSWDIRKPSILASYHQCFLIHQRILSVESTYPTSLSKGKVDTRQATFFFFGGCGWSFLLLAEAKNCRIWEVSPPTNKGIQLPHHLVNQISAFQHITLLVWVTESLLA